MNLIAEHYSEIKKIIPDDTFEVKMPDLPNWAQIDDDLYSSVEVKVPEELKSLKVVQKEKDKIYFNKDVDSTGQPYSIFYNIASNKLVLDFNSSIEETFDPVLQDYKDLKKKLDKYLKQLEKEA